MAREREFTDHVLLFALVERCSGGDRRLCLEPLGVDCGRYGIPLGPDDEVLLLIKPGTGGIEMAWRPGPDNKPEILSVGKLEF